MRAEFKAVDEAYQSALAIDPNYSEVRQALMRTQILILNDWTRS